VGATAAVKLAQYAMAGGAAAGTVGVVTESYNMMDSGSFNIDDVDFVTPDLVDDVPEQSMNFSKLLSNDEDYLNTTAPKAISESPAAMSSMAAPVAVAGGIQAMRAVYNRLQGGNDQDNPVDEDTPGMQEIMSQVASHHTTIKSIPDASRWAQMHGMQQSFNQSVAQESTRNGAGFFMHSTA
jgi:hypothetical protein